MVNIQLNTQLSPTAKKTLRSIHDKGGRATARTGQPGINPNSFRPLIREGLLEWLDYCDACEARRFWAVPEDTPCERPIHGQRCFAPVEITKEGRRYLEQEALTTC